MRMSLLVGASFLALTTLASAQSATLRPAPPLTLRFTNATFSDALAAVARESGVTIRVSDTVPTEVLNRELTLTFNDAPVAAAIEFLARQAGLDVLVADENTVIISAKPK
jgi:hypothetical protein